MSKLFDDASLAMIPSAYKDGKLYSIRPTDGSGDFTFSRGSNLAATRVDVNGLIEKGRENLITYSNDFNQWNIQNVAVTSNAVSNPFNTGTTQTITEQVGTSTQYRVYSTSYTASSGTMYTHSVYVKRLTGTRDFAIIDVNVGARVYFDMTNIAVGTELIGKGKIEDVGNGWYRLSVYGLATGSSGFYLALCDGSTASSETYNADGSGSYALYGAQLEKGLVATDYIETGASTAQAGILEDMPRLDYSGSCPALLLEPQRTNVVSQSEYFGAWNEQGTASVTDNQAVSPEGVQNAALLDLGATSGGFNRIDIDAPISAGTDYVFSVFVKNIDVDNISISNFETGNYLNATFDLVNGIKYSTPTSYIEDYGNDWWRVSLVFSTNTATTASLRIQPSLNGSYPSQGEQFYIYGATLEQGSYPTSYIPTYGSSVTRSKDNCLNSSLATSSDFTIFFEANDYAKINGGDGVFSQIQFVFGAGTSPYDSGGGVHIYNRFWFYFDAPDVFNIGQIYGSNTDTKFAIVKRGDELIRFANGVKLGSYTMRNPNTSINWDTLDIAGAMQDAQGDTHIPYFKQLAKFDTALTDSECIALTTL